MFAENQEQMRNALRILSCKCALSLTLSMTGVEHVSSCATSPLGITCCYHPPTHTLAVGTRSHSKSKSRHREEGASSRNHGDFSPILKRSGRRREHGERVFLADSIRSSERVEQTGRIMRRGDFLSATLCRRRRRRRIE